MIVEALAAGTAYTLGWGIVRLFGSSVGYGFVALAAYPFGVSLWVAVGCMILATSMPYHPLGATLVTVAAVGFLNCRFARWPSPSEIIWLAAGSSSVLVIAALCAHFEWTFVTSDTLMILGVADQIFEAGTLTTSVKASLASFPLYLSVVNTVPVWFGLTYLKAVNPLFAVCSIGLVGVLGARALRRGQMATPFAAASLSVLTAAALGTTPLFVWTALYVNGHGIFACLLLLAVAGFHLAEVERDPAWWILALVASTSLLPLRMESGLTALPLLVIAACSHTVSLRLRLLAVGSVGVAFGLWYAGLIIRSFGHGLLGVYELFIIGVVPGVFGTSLLAGFILRAFGLTERMIETLLRGLPAAMLAVLLATVGVHEFMQPGASLRAFSIFAGFLADSRNGANVYVATALVLLLATPLMTPSHPEARPIIIALTAFILIVFVIGVRTPWQDSSLSDSTNRMLTHVLPALLYYVLVKYGAALREYRAPPPAAPRDPL